MKEEWHSRGYLPHWEAGEIAQSITFRVADSLPAELLQRWRDELKGLSEDKIALKRRARIEAALDRGHGSGAAEPSCGRRTSRALFAAFRHRPLQTACVVDHAQPCACACHAGAWANSVGNNTQLEIVQREEGERSSLPWRHVLGAGIFRSRYQGRGALPECAWLYCNKSCESWLV